MKRKLCLCLIIFIGLQSDQQTFAQANKRESFSINFGPEISFPESTLKTTHNTGYGGSFKAEYTFGKHGSATINSGLSAFKGKGYFDNVQLQQKEYESLIVIPVKVGLRYYISRFYAAGEAGVVFLSKYANTPRPVVSIGVGDKIKINYHKIDISLRQEFWLGNPRNLNILVLRAAYEIVW
jgi:hypothetical protein